MPSRSCLTCRRRVRRLPDLDPVKAAMLASLGEAGRTVEERVAEGVLRVAKGCPYCGGRRSQL
jgi:hypothetical protein